MNGRPPAIPVRCFRRTKQLRWKKEVKYAMHACIVNRIDVAGYGIVLVYIGFI